MLALRRKGAQVGGGRVVVVDASAAIVKSEDEEK